MASRTVRTRQQTRQDLIPTAANLKRQAIDSPGKQPQRKRSALGDVTSAIGNVLIDSSKKKTLQKLTTLTNIRTRRSSADAQLSPLSEDINEDAFPPLPSLGLDGTLSDESSSDIRRPSSSTSDSEVECRRLSSKLIGRPSIRKESPKKVTVPDFDLENINDPFQMPHYAQDIFTYYRSRESKFVVDDYLIRQTSISQEMRTVLVDWLVEIQENFELNHETLYQAVKMTDLYLTNHIIAKDKLQLVGATALFISCKFDERQPPCLDDFLYICDDAYSREELIESEMEFLKTLEFDIGVPSSYRFLRRYAKVSKVSMETLTLGRYILETSLMHYEFVSMSDSRMAAAAFLLALRIKGGPEWGATQEHYSGYKSSDVESLMWQLNDMLISAQENNDVVTVKNKYSHDVFFGVANLSPLSRQ